MDEQLNELYRDIIMEHYRFPRGQEKISDPDMTNEGHNPVCGDEIELQVKMSDDKIATVSIDCAGCAISTASGSMLAEICEGKTMTPLTFIISSLRPLIRD